MGICPCPRRKQPKQETAINDTDGDNIENEEKSVITEQQRQSTANTLNDELEEKLTHTVKVVKSSPTVYRKVTIVQATIKYVPPTMIKQSSEGNKSLYTVRKKQKMMRRAQSADYKTYNQQQPQSKSPLGYLNQNITHYKKSQKDPDSEIKNDTRFLNKDWESYPYNCIGLIVGQRLNKKDKYQTFIGTGFLISQNLVLTAAHNVFFDQTNSINQFLKFYPKLHGHIEDFQETRNVVEWRIHPNYMESYGGSLDFALVKIDEEVIRDRYIMIGQDYPKLAKASIYGYPLDLNQDFETKGYCQFGGEGEIIQNNKETLMYQIDTMPGQSGSPIVIQFVK